MFKFEFPTISDDMADASLADMERLGARPYSEIGVPMFLVAEDLSAPVAGAVPVRRGPDASGRVLALLLADAAQALRARRPDLTAKDVARLVETLADRHFLGLAAPAFSLSADLHPEAG